MPREARAFAAKTARSIAEIQQSVNNMADVVVFLEVLGYGDRTAQQNGFASLHDLARYVYDFVDVFEESGEERERQQLPEPEQQAGAQRAGEAPVSSRGRRLAESLGMVFPWLGSLVLLFATGVSLWMAYGLPADVTTAFLAGVFLGLVATEGLLQNYHRLFSFYYSQTNIGEVRRSVRRSYTLLGVILAAVTAAIYGVSMAANVPLALASIAAASAVTISLHRVSYVVLYALKKLAHVGISYACAFAVLLAVFFLVPAQADAAPDASARYFWALGAAFGILSIFAAYHHYRIMAGRSESIVARDTPHFYSPVTVSDDTIASRFGVQLWECLPYFLYGTFYFMLLFADRAVSWFYNPSPVAAAANGAVLPLAFNSAYHAGADLALVIILPAAVVQYVMTQPVYALVHNRATALKVWESRKIDLFLQHSYRRLLAGSVIASLLTAAAVNVAAPEIMAAVGGTEASLRILAYASAGAVLLSAYAANGIFLVFLGRAKALALISLAAALVVIAGGAIMAQLFGFESIVFAYVAAAAVAASATGAAMVRAMKKAGSHLFARYV